MTRLAFPLAALLALTPHSASAQEPKPTTLRWYGQSFFQLETAAGKRVAFDPHAIPQFGRPIVAADVVLVSHPHNDHNQVEVIDNLKAARVFEGVKPGAKGRGLDWNRVDEKVGGVRVRSVGTYHDAENGLKRGKNAVWVVEADGLTVCHLGDLGHELTPEQVRAIGPVDVLLIPVGGVYTLNGEQAKRVQAQLKPRRAVVPMHYGVPGYDDLLTPDEFLDGQSSVKRLPDTNEYSVPAGDPPADGPAVVLLGWQKGK